MSTTLTKTDEACLLASDLIRQACAEASDKAAADIIARLQGTAVTPRVKLPSVSAGAVAILSLCTAVGTAVALIVGRIA